MKLRFRFLLSLSFSLFLLAGGPLLAQDEFDLSLPGEEESTPAPAPAAASDSPAEGTASTGEVNLLEMIKAGGWSMWVLGTFSFAVIGLLIYCLIDLQRKNFHPEVLYGALAVDMENADFDAAVQKAQSAPTCLSGVMQAAIHFIAERGYGVLDSEKLEETMAAASRKFNRGRVRTINYFSVIAQAAPMMGLLGTVSGMIGAFAKLSQGGTGDPSKCAGDISEALITTATGLVVALPAIFCYFIFRDRLQQLVAECDECAEELISILRRTIVSSQEHH
jgi:biopolymer transport protein ExbB